MMKKLSLELGGKNAAIVYDDADLDKVKNTIKSKGMSADAEKTDGGVKVHTYDTNRSSIAKALGIDVLTGGGRCSGESLSCSWHKRKVIKGGGEHGN